MAGSISICRLPFNPQALVSIARSQLGSGGSTYLSAAYGPGYYIALCATFQWWVFHQEGAGDLFYGGGISPSPLQIMEYYQSRGQLTNFPQPGDLVFILLTHYVSHIAMVTMVSGDSIKIVEGNGLHGRVEERWIEKWGGRGGAAAYARPNS